MKRITALVVLVGIAAIAAAMSTYSTTFNTKYSIQRTSKIGKAGCKLCHTSARGGAVTKYGADVKAALAAANTKRLTPALLASIESKDSNGDGVANGASIKKDVLP